MSKKLEKVLEHLINGREAEAKELLHQVFIEKARAIHEELINMDEESMDEMGGDMGDDLIDDVEEKSDYLDELADEIEAEETMAEAEDDMDMGTAEDDIADEMESDEDAEMMDMDMEMADDEAADAEMADEVADEDMEGIEATMGDLEDALAALKAEFEKLEAGVEKSEDESMEAEADDEAAEDEEAEDDEEKMDESWLAEFDDLEESMHLDAVSPPSNDEVGAGKFAKPETNTKSPVAKAPAEMFGAKPVQTGKGPAKSGFDRESAPSAEQLKGVKDNRRKKADDGMSAVGKEGDSSAMLNKSQGEPNKKSPLTQSPRK